MYSMSSLQDTGSTTELESQTSLKVKSQEKTTIKTFSYVPNSQLLYEFWKSILKFRFWDFYTKCFLNTKNGSKTSVHDLLSYNWLFRAKMN